MLFETIWRAAHVGDYGGGSRKAERAAQMTATPERVSVMLYGVRDRHRKREREKERRREGERGREG